MRETERRGKERAERREELYASFRRKLCSGVHITASEKEGEVSRKMRDECSRDESRISRERIKKKGQKRHLFAHISAETFNV